MHKLDLTVREAKLADIPALLTLIKELALFERAPEKVSNTIEQMEKDGFAEQALFGAYVAELDGEIIGMAIHYYRYSTWRGRCLYLEDLIVTEKHRGKGAGKLLFEKCLEFAKENKCQYMNWQVLDWNTPSIDFYKSYGTEFEDEWMNCSLHV